MYRYVDTLPISSVTRHVEIVESSDGLCYSQRVPHNRLATHSGSSPAVLLFFAAILALCGRRCGATFARPNHAVDDCQYEALILG